MKSLLREALKLEYEPVAILWTDDLPPDALEFSRGKWGCVMSLFGTVAQRGRTAAFSRETFGCWGGGVGLGFGNAYLGFPGGLDGFCGFLSDGNEKSEKGRAVAEQCASWMRGELREEFLHGEGYRKNPELVQQWVASLPLTDVPTRYVVFKQLPHLTAEERPVSIVFLANPDQMSALVVMANYARPGGENAVIPHAAGCQSIGIFTYRETEASKPRAVVGLNDISARRQLRRLGKDLVTVSVPLALYQEMEANVAGSFLEKEQWRSLISPQP
ncbi:MAG: hypothetical protein EHM61_08705 [Acidobacteria bacterium]|nr:MAG: hypothetical protein EHM61_08705 [Acidobacteriota bacterium]